MNIPVISPTGLVGESVRLVEGHGDTQEDVSVPWGAVIAVLLTAEQALDIMDQSDADLMTPVQDMGWVCDLSQTLASPPVQRLVPITRTWNVTLDVSMTARVEFRVDAHDEETACSDARESFEMDATISTGDGEVTDEDVSNVDVVECVRAED